MFRLGVGLGLTGNKASPLASAVAGKKGSGVAVGSPEFALLEQAERRMLKTMRTSKEEAKCFFISFNPLYYKRYREII